MTSPELSSELKTVLGVIGGAMYSGLGDLGAIDLIGLVSSTALLNFCIRSMDVSSIFAYLVN